MAEQQPPGLKKELQAIDTETALAVIHRWVDKLHVLIDGETPHEVIRELTSNIDRYDVTIPITLACVEVGQSLDYEEQRVGDLALGGCLALSVLAEIAQEQALAD